MKRIATILVVLASLAALGCGRESPPSTATGGAASASAGAKGATTQPAAGAGGAATQANAAANKAPVPAAEPQAANAGIAPGSVAVAQLGQPISNKALELRVTGIRTAPAVGNRTAASGREFVIVETAWKSLVPPQKVNRKKAQDRTGGMASLGFGGGATAKDKAADDADTTLEQVPFEMGPMTTHLWLIVNGRDAEAIATDATLRADGHLSAGTLKSRPSSRSSAARWSSKRRWMLRRSPCCFWTRRTGISWSR